MIHLNNNQEEQIKEWRRNSYKRENSCKRKTFERSIKIESQDEIYTCIYNI